MTKRVNSKRLSANKRQIKQSSPFAERKIVIGGNSVLEVAKGYKQEYILVRKYVSPNPKIS